MSHTSQRSPLTLRDWFVVSAFAVVGLAFFFGALNTFQQESAAAEGSAYPTLATDRKTVFVICPPREASDGAAAAATDADPGDRFQGLMGVVGPSGVDAVFTSERHDRVRGFQHPTDLQGVPIELVRVMTPNSMADAILSSEHRVIVAVSEPASLDRLLAGLGIVAVPRIGEAGDDLLVVSTEGVGTANLVHLRY